MEGQAGTYPKKTNPSVYISNKAVLKNNKLSLTVLSREARNKVLTLMKNLIAFGRDQEESLYMHTYTVHRLLILFIGSRIYSTVLKKWHYAARKCAARHRLLY